MQDAIDAGTADLYYYDGGNNWIAYDDLDDAFGLIHAMNRMHAPGAQSGGYRVLPNIVKTTGYSEDAGHRPARHHRAVRHHLGEAQAGRRAPIDYPLENGGTRRLIAGTQISVELNLTADDNVTDINADDRRDRHARVAGVAAHHWRSAVGDDIEDIDDLADGRDVSARIWAPDRPRSTSRVISLSSIAGVTTPSRASTATWGFTLERVTPARPTRSTIAAHPCMCSCMDATGSITVASDDTP